MRVLDTRKRNAVLHTFLEDYWTVFDINRGQYASIGPTPKLRVVELKSGFSDPPGGKTCSMLNPTPLAFLTEIKDSVA